MLFAQARSSSAHLFPSGISLVSILSPLLQVFQIVSQAIVQNFFPRFHIYHTSRKHKGQVQWQAFICCLTVPLVHCANFQSGLWTLGIHSAPSPQGVLAQVYIPFVNYLLMCLCIIIIVIFQTSDRLGQAYGAAFTTAPWLVCLTGQVRCLRALKRACACFCRLGS